MQAKSVWKVGGSIVVVALMLFTLFLGILPTLFAVQDLDERTSIAEQQIVEQVAYLEKLKALSENVDELLNTVTDRRNLIPDGLEVENLMNEMGRSIFWEGMSILASLFCRYLQKLPHLVRSVELWVIIPPAT